VDSTAFTAYITGGEARKKVTVISGLDHLEGETVSILGDGSVQNDKVVTAGAITIDTRAAVVCVGLSYVSNMKQLRLEAGAQNGTSIGKTRRVHRVGLLLNNTTGIKIGADFTTMDRIITRNSNDQVNTATPLFSGIHSTTVEFPYDFQSQVCIQADQPLPATILAIMPQLDTQDRQ
jgi:hypothetical protein